MSGTATKPSDLPEFSGQKRTDPPDVNDPGSRLLRRQALMHRSPGQQQGWGMILFDTAQSTSSSRRRIHDRSVKPQRRSLAPIAATDPSATAIYGFSINIHNRTHREFITPPLVPYRCPAVNDIRTDSQFQASASLFLARHPPGMTPKIYSSSCLQVGYDKRSYTGRPSSTIRNGRPSGV